MNRKKILIITRNLPPLVGGMERLNWHMADELSKYAEVKVIGPQGAAQNKPERVHVTEAPLKPLPLFLIVSFLKAIWLALRWRPDVILAGSGLTAPLAWLASKLCGARSAAYLHGLDITVKDKIYQRYWTPTFRKIDHVIVNSTPTKGLVFAAGVPERKITIVHPGVKLPEAPQSAEAIQTFKEQHGLIGKKILLSVGRLTTRKGLREFVEFSLPKIVEADPNAILVVIGEAPKNSLGASVQTVESIQEQAKRYGVADNILFLGVITDKTLLATAYEAANVHVFPVRDIPGDPEGFGMVAIEAAAHGLPTVAFAVGGVVDAVKDGVSGHLVEQNNYSQMSTMTISTLRGPAPIQNILEFSRHFSWRKFAKQIEDSLFESARSLPPHRQAHAVLDLSSRISKAKKIEFLMGLNIHPRENYLRVLEVGCGSGVIAHYFATHALQSCDVTAVDITDNRQIKETYKFLQVAGVELPFPSNSFDLVISNHVIEHVGEANDQVQHLKEITRVLTPGGLGYLAVPNRWMINEPHYNLRFLSWLPRRLRTRYLRLAGKGPFYDCEPLQMKELEQMLRKAETDFINISIPAARITFELEKPDSFATKLLRILPDFALLSFQPLIPTLVYRLEKK